MIESRADLPSMPDLRLRPVIQAADRESVRRIVADSQFFSESEVSIAVELVEERLLKGPSSGYEFLMAEFSSREHAGGAKNLAGYICYGEIPCTVGSYDIYWIVVATEYRRNGIGRLLMHAAEQEIKNLNGRQLYIDTSGKDLYASTREFYSRCGFTVACEIPDFYAEGDSKVIYAKPLHTEQGTKASPREVKLSGGGMQTS